VNCVGEVAEGIVDEILETAEDMDTEEIAELLDGAHVGGPDMSMSDDLSFGAGPNQSNEEGSDEGTESDEVTTDEEVLDEERYNSAGEEVRVAISAASYCMFRMQVDVAVLLMLLCWFARWMMKSLTIASWTCTQLMSQVLI